MRWGLQLTEFPRGCATLDNPSNPRNKQSEGYFSAMIALTYARLPQFDMLLSGKYLATSGDAGSAWRTCRGRRPSTWTGRILDGVRQFFSVSQFSFSQCFRSRSVVSLAPVTEGAPSVRSRPKYEI